MHGEKEDIKFNVYYIKTFYDKVIREKKNIKLFLIYGQNQSSVGN